MSCPGIEIEPGVHSGCIDIECWLCNGTGVMRNDPSFGPVECSVCQGCGAMSDCPNCKPKTCRVEGMRPAHFTNFGSGKPFTTYADGEF